MQASRHGLAVACPGPKSASGQKVAAPEVRQENPAVSYGKDRVKRCPADNFTTEEVVVENNYLSQKQ
nr:hypothetical protein SYMBAF_50104 [Serratia symbiotica]